MLAKSADTKRHDIHLTSFDTARLNRLHLARSDTTQHERLHLSDRCGITQYDRLHLGRSFNTPRCYKHRLQQLWREVLTQIILLPALSNCPLQGLWFLMAGTQLRPPLPISGHSYHSLQIFHLVFLINQHFPKLITSTLKTEAVRSYEMFIDSIITLRKFITVTILYIVNKHTAVHKIVSDV